MPPQTYSRYFFTQGIKDADENLFLTDRVPYRFQDLDDNRFHTVRVGDTLHSLADKYFDGIPNAASLYWVLGDYQPEPIIDATLTLTPGRRLVIPSTRVLTEQIFSEARRNE